MIVITDQMSVRLSQVILVLLLLVMAAESPAVERRLIEAAGTEVEVRIYPAEGDVLLLGFPCDEGKSVAEEKTARSLAEDGIEVWMPDFLSAYMLPKLRSSLASIETEAIRSLIDEASQRGKTVYLVASGPDTELILRGALDWEHQQRKPGLGGAILLFPRLFKESPEPGKMPEYVEAVGRTQLPLMLLEGERTPNRWGLPDLSEALHQGGSPVISKVIPMVRGYFFKRGDANRSEDVVTSQLAGLIKVSLFYLQKQESKQ